jgi:hypothetical protein
VRLFLPSSVFIKLDCLLSFVLCDVVCVMISGEGERIAAVFEPEAGVGAGAV